MPFSLYREPKSPFWWVRVTIAGHKVKRSSKTAERERAEAFGKALADRLWEQHKLGDRGAVSFGEVCQRWLSETTKRSKDKDELILRWFLAAEPMREAALKDVDRDAIDVLRALLVQQGKSRATADRYMACLRALLRKARDDWGYLTVAPKVPMFNPPRLEPRWLTPTEFWQLYAKLPENLKAPALFAVATGLRMRAMLSLPWRQIDIGGRRGWVAAQFMKGGKTHGFPLSELAIRALKLAKKFQDQQRGEHLRRCERLRLAPEPLPDRVFTYRGRPVDDCNTKAYQDAVRAAGLAGVDWHTLRHTFASWAVRAGVTLQELMKLGPWESYAMVLRYAHLAPDHLQQAASKVSKIGATALERPRRKTA